MKHNPIWEPWDEPIPRARPTLSEVAGTILGTMAFITLAYLFAPVVAHLLGK